MKVELRQSTKAASDSDGFEVVRRVEYQHSKVLEVAGGRTEKLLVEIEFPTEANQDSTVLQGEVECR
ncbi:hypothetical protein [Melittangium boletus]|uniref:hypothetical protein n=1 Tax=Melittangium boletus TaxID=83453 RepID=UPI003DA547CB